MARLEAVKKGLYYPTPERIVRLIADEVPVSGGGRLLDPCAGEGIAAGMLADAWGLDAYGVELHEERAEKARHRLDRVWCGSYHQLSCDPGSFNVLFLNPPYDEGRTADNRAIRQEVLFLRETLPHLVEGGLLVLIVPELVLQNETFRNLMQQRCEAVEVFRFPAPEFAAFHQIVVLARRAGRYCWGRLPDEGEKLPVLRDGCRANASVVDLPAPKGGTAFVFRKFNPVAAAPSWSDGAGCYGSKQWAILTGARDLATFDRPLCVPRTGHQAMLLAAGALNGTEISGRQLIKGSSEKIVQTSFDEENRKKIDRERLVSSLSILDLTTGALDTWRTDNDPAKTQEWFEVNGIQLARAIQRDHQPQFDGDLSGFDFSGVRAPGVLPGHTKPVILEKQKEAAAAIAFRWGGHKSAVLSGEMGVGKTTCALVATHLSGLRKVIVVCPGHLVPKWLREAATVTKAPGCAIEAKRLSDVDRFFREPELRFMILSKERAKLGACWRPAAIPREELREVDTDQGKVQRKVTVFDCPRCRTRIEDEDEFPVDFDFLTRRKRACPKCSEALWQATPISDKGTLRWPLARYVNRRYAKRFSLVVDEAHQYAAADSDQSRAMQHLGVAAQHLLAMTGTLYGGRASSIFHLLYKVDAGFRSLYRYDECALFVSHHGLLETVSDMEEERSSRYGYKRGGAGGRTREIPGVHPAMITLLLPSTVFLKLEDLGYELPPFSEEVELIDHDPDVTQACRTFMQEVRSILRQHPRALGGYLAACLGYPDRADQVEVIVDRESEWDEGTIVASAPALPNATYPKDDRLVEIAVAEKRKGRRTLAYFTQVHRRSAVERCKARLEAAGLRVAVLGSEIAPAKREAWLQRRAREIDVLLTNGKLVETGLDLIEFPTLVQFGIEYSTPTLRQQTRRSWRLGQTEPVKVIYLAYRGTMQEHAIHLISRKMRAAELVDGDATGGLGQFDDTGADFFLELAREAIEAESRPPTPPPARRIQRRRAAVDVAVGQLSLFAQAA